MNRFRPLVLVPLILALAGCLQIETRIVLHEDGSATITEKLRFSRALLDLEATEAAGLKLSRFLEKDAALERMKHMGKGIELVSHKIDDVEKGARESVAVYKIPDLSDFRYVSPYVAHLDYATNNVLAARLFPLYKSENYVGTAGEMGVTFLPEKPARGESRESPLPPAPTPAELQVYRELRPVFRDVLRDFKLRLTLETYAPIRTTGFGLRGQQAGVNYVDIICVTDEDLDKHGGKFFENEEIMVELLQGKPGGQNIVDHTAGFAGNLTVPLFLSWGSRYCPWRGSNGIFFKPSLALFKKHFEGKKLDYSRWAPSPEDKHVPALFENIGYRKEPAAQPK